MIDISRKKSDKELYRQARPKNSLVYNSPGYRMLEDVCSDDEQSNLVDPRKAHLCYDGHHILLADGNSKVHSNSRCWVATRNPTNLAPRVILAVV